MEEQLPVEEKKPFYRKRLIIGAAVIVIGLVLLVILAVFLSRQKERISSVTGPTPTVAVQQPTESAKTDSSQSRTPPEVYFEQYDNQAGLPQLSESVNSYTFKTNYTLEEAREFGKRLGLEQYKEDPAQSPEGNEAGRGDWLVMYNVEDKDKRGVLSFHLPTGSFSYTSWTVTKPKSQIPNPNNQTNSNYQIQIAQTFLAELGVIDDIVSCPITYQRQGMEGVTFVECHRDWGKVGLPILGYPGILNVPENKPLTQLALGGVDENTPKDESIINVQRNGEALRQAQGAVRPNDFNTATIAVTDDGRILAIESNLRQMVAVVNTAATDLLTPPEALTRFLSHQAEQSLTIPAGSGVVDWDKVYQENLAQAKQAIITDYVLVYLEKPAQVPQDKLVPYYLIRGLAQLTTGYNVRFAEIVPATRNRLSFLGGQVAGYQSAPGKTGESTYLAQRTIKLEGFTPVPTQPEEVWPSSTPRPTTLKKDAPWPTLPGDLSFCTAFYEPIVDAYNLEIPGVGVLRVAGGLQGFVFVNFKPTNGQLVESIEQVRALFFKATEEQYKINVAKEMYQYPEPKSIDDMYAIFDQLNGNVAIESEDSPTMEQAWWGCDWTVAPLRPDGKCISLSGWFGTEDDRPVYDPLGINIAARVKEISHNTGQDLLQLSRSGKLESLSNRPDVFPEEVVKDFKYVFVVSWIHSINALAGGPVCYIVSGSSPILFLYPQEATEVAINIDGLVTYTDPFPNEDEEMWHVEVLPNGQIINRSYLYYEYDRSMVFFTEPAEGFVIRQEKWEEEVRGIALALELTEMEAEALITDVGNALLDVEDTKYLKISLVGREELDEQLPVEITPKPNHFHRVHLLLTPLESYQKINQPKLNQLPRKGFTVVEVGVR